MCSGSDIGGMYGGVKVGGIACDSGRYMLFTV